MAEVTQLAEGLHCIDLAFQGQPGVIAAYLVEDAGERALIETGPASTLDTLVEGLHSIGVDPDTISKLLVTHIHLDHSGAAGAFIQRHPAARLFVHEIGAPHLIDPSRLLASATRIYGDMMDTLWGRVVPVPESKMAVLTDGSTVAVGTKRLTALYTPGHASHHVVYHDAGRGAVFAGDVAAVRLQGVPYVRPPAPPPDIDLEQWSRSLERISDLRPSVLYLTHFGPSSEVEWHLREARDRLFEWAGVVERGLRSGQDPPAIVDNLRLHGDAELLRLTNDASLLERYELAAPYGMSVDGYLRYLRKRMQIPS